MKTLISVCACAAAALVLAGCTKSAPGTSGSASSSSAAAPARTSSANDYKVPALTEDKIQKFISSMKEQNNPLEFLFKQGGAMRNIAEMKAKEIEFNAFAQKYGFKDYTEYVDTWGRIMVGQMQISSQQMLKGLNESLEKSAKEAEENLKKPNLSPETKEMYQSQIDSYKKSVAEAEKTDDSGLNAIDLALVAKYNDQINEEAKKYKP